MGRLIASIALLSCGAPEAQCEDAGKPTIGVEDLNKIKLECLEWREYYYFEGTGYHSIWICDKWLGQ